MGYLLQHLLIESARLSPEKTAVVYQDNSLSYRQLDELSNQVAHALVQQGVKRGERVGIYINKSIPSLISIYGILKAEAVYVPLDPQAPVSRLGYIIDNCTIRCLLTSTAKTPVMHELAKTTESLEVVIFTDTQKEVDELPLINLLWTDVLEMPKLAIENVSDHSDLAYIIYTSGSTGNPKGVMITHLNSLTFVNWAHDAMEVQSSDNFSSHAPFHFDLSIFDIYVAAKAGGTLYLVPETLSMFPPRLSAWIEQHQISVWYSVPSILTMMVNHGQLDQRNLSCLRKVIFAGEVFPTKFLRDLMRLVPHPEFFNLYGPTETNVITYYPVPVIPAEQTAPIPIGKCCENMDVFVISKDGVHITEPGIEGELIARGTCVAKGYWGDEEKTKKVFIKNPLENNFYDQAYKTGDLVQLDEQGNFIYKGRIDHMIKSRGYRIEIGEIETAIYSHPQVKEVAVLAIPDDLITNRIKAVIALKADSTIDAAELRTFCAETLPKYMIPEIFEFKAVLPKTSTGKVDKTSMLKDALV
ncbi:MAG: hypothetical protein DHS20C17_14400 [Cyclobacteriaceae bacterium]|nr:MAG: hypothetical protein DHS20C17_14400 [Cyclobacteriaceae bacterium]